MHTLRLALLLGVGSGILGLACAVAVDPNAKLFDRLITKGVIAREFGPRKPFDFSTTEAEDGARLFVAEYRFKRRSPAEHYTLSIAVAPAGRYLDPVAYQKRRGSEARGDAALEADYPSIGRRAQREFLGMGPGGAAYGLTFTTSDGRFDVRITVSNLMPEGTEEPQFDLEGFARRLSERYDTATNAALSKTPSQDNP